MLHMPAPRVSEADIEMVLDALVGAGWVGRDILARRLGISIRTLRRIAEYSGGRILSAPGSPGYRSNDTSATKGDILRTADQHFSQAKRHQKRGLEILKRMHTRLPDFP